MSEKIDFVIPWVDSNDKEWQNDFNKYSPENKILNNFDRYRDWNSLHYIFRSFEKFTPWVNKIYFITYGHVPSWLNINHPKLVIVKHEDYMLEENLPVFSSHPIEINLHRIEGLSEQFVYFNDDFFILKPLKPEEFFYQKKPVDMAISNIMHDGIISHIIMNNIDIINKNFNRHVGDKLTKRGIIKKHFLKWFSFKYGIHSFQTLLLLYWKTFTGFTVNHHPQPFLKSTFEEVWVSESEILKNTSSSKFRDDKDVNQYLFRYWQLVKGTFYPDSASNMIDKRQYKEIKIKKDAEDIALDIQSQKYKMYCINDATSKGRYTKEDISQEDFEYSKEIINNALREILPDKSKFEN